MKKIIILLLVFCYGVNFAQELNAKVIVNYEQLETSSKERLDSFAQLVEDYLNNNHFAGDSWEGDPITCNFSIFFTSASENNYTAQVVITSQRPVYQSDNMSLMLLVQDPNWSFVYEENQTLYYDQNTFDPLTSFLDYYALVIIGLDMDSYDPPQGGTELFSQASDIAVVGSNSAYSTGWALVTSSYNKRGLVEDLLRANFEQFRIDFCDYHYNGLDMMNEDKEFAISNVVKLVKNLDGIYDKVGRMNVLLGVFFDTKHKEIFGLLKDYPDKDVLRLLKKIDPSHISTYDEGLND